MITSSRAEPRTLAMTGGAQRRQKYGSNPTPFLNEWVPFSSEHLHLIDVWENRTTV